MSEHGLIMDLQASMDATTGYKWKRDPDADCAGFAQGRLSVGEFADCETDGHFVCGYCKYRKPAPQDPA